MKRISRTKHSLWDGVLSRLDLTEEFLRYAVIKGELTVQHGEQNHAKSPHVTGFATVWPPWTEKNSCRVRKNRTGFDRDLKQHLFSAIIMSALEFGEPFKVQLMATSKMILKISKHGD